MISTRDYCHVKCHMCSSLLLRQGLTTQACLSGAHTSCPPPASLSTRTTSIRTTPSNVVILQGRQFITLSLSLHFIFYIQIFRDQIKVNILVDQKFIVFTESLNTMKTH